MTTTKAKRAPSGKTKLVTLHVDGKSANVGFAEFLHDVVRAVGNRSQSDLERVQSGSPVLHVNAAGELVVYVSEYSV